MTASPAIVPAGPPASAEATFAARAAGAGHQTPAEVLDTAALLLADLVGVALAGSREPEFETVAEVVAGSGPHRGTGRVWGTVYRLPPAEAAFLNSFSGHLLDFDDDETEFAMAHLSVTSLPAACAAADHLAAQGKPPSGARVLEAYVASFELGLDLGAVLNPSLYRAGWHATSVLGTLVATVAAGRLLGLDAERMGHALALAASSASGMRSGFGSEAKPFQVARSAQAGVLAAQAAAAGLKGSVGTLFGPGSLAALFAGTVEEPASSSQHQKFPPESLVIKAYPCCTAMHSAVTALIGLVRTHRIEPLRIRRIHCRIDPFVLRILVHARPSSPHEARFSLPFGLAAAACRGQLGPEEFEPDVLRHPQVQALIDRVEVEPWDGFPKGRSGVSTAAAVTITLIDGTVLMADVAAPPGSAANPLGRRGIEEKFVACAGRSLGPARAASAFRRLAAARHEADLSATLGDAVSVEPATRHETERGIQK